MKPKILTTIIVVFLCFLFGNMQAQEHVEWEYVCSLTGEQLCKVYAQGKDTVYVVGENGLIAQSTDKGSTWDKKYFFNEETLNDIIFCNHDIGFIVGNNGTILRTQDAGLSWVQMTSGTVQNINAIAAFDLNNIWIVGNGSLIMHSTDMGETWTMKPFLSDSYNLKDIECKGDKGYITGQGGVVLNTEDGGIMWKEQILTGYEEYSEISSLCITENKVYALGGGIIFTKDDVNWQDLESLEFFKASIYFQDDQNGLMLSYDYTTCCSGSMGVWIFKTTDGGNRWEDVYYNSFPKEIFDLGLKSNFAFSSNNEFGYCIWGKNLMRTYTSEFDDCVEAGVINVKSWDLVLNQQGEELQIQSHSKKIDRVEFIAIDGRKIMQEITHGNVLNIDVSSLSEGIYLINVLFSDKTNYFDKWTKKN